MKYFTLFNFCQGQMIPCTVEGLSLGGKRMTADGTGKSFSGFGVSFQMVLKTTSGGQDFVTDSALELRFLVNFLHMKVKVARSLELSAWTDTAFEGGYGCDDDFWSIKFVVKFVNIVV